MDFPALRDLCRASVVGGNRKQSTVHLIQLRLIEVVVYEKVDESHTGVDVVLLRIDVPGIFTGAAAAVCGITCMIPTAPSGRFMVLI